MKRTAVRCCYKVLRQGTMACQKYTAARNYDIALWQETATCDMTLRQPPEPSQNDTASASTRALRTPPEETRSPSIYTPASLFRASSTSLGLGSQPMVADMAQTSIAVSFLSRLVVAYASEMVARWEYRRLVWRAELNSEKYGLSPPAYLS